MSHVLGKEENSCISKNETPLLLEEGYQDLFASYLSLSKKSLRRLDFSDEFKKLLASQLPSIKS